MFELWGKGAKKDVGDYVEEAQAYNSVEQVKRSMQQRAPRE